MMQVAKMVKIVQGEEHVKNGEVHACTLRMVKQKLLPKQHHAVINRRHCDIAKVLMMFDG